MNSKSQMPQRVTLVTTFTMALWVSCMVIAIAGIRLPRPGRAGPQVPPASQPTDVMEVSTVVLEDMPADAAVESTSIEPPPIVALPTASIAFAQPVEGPVQLADLMSVISPRVEPSAELPVQREFKARAGERPQPKPEYPPEALRRREQGLVVVQFLVDTNGNIAHVSILTPSGWPLLNESALHNVRDEWHPLAPGSVRSYRVPINFSLKESE